MNEPSLLADEATWQQANLDYLQGHFQRLRLLLARQDREGQEHVGQEETGAAGDQDQERRQGLSDGTALDDQPLTHAMTSNE